MATKQPFRRESIVLRLQNYNDVTTIICVGSRGYASWCCARFQDCSGTSAPLLVTNRRTAAATTTSQLARARIVKL